MILNKSLIIEKRFFRNNHTNTFVSSADLVTDSNLDVKINESSIIKCGGSITPICNGTSESTCDEDKCVWEEDKQKCLIKQNIPKNKKTL